MRSQRDSDRSVASSKPIVEAVAMDRPTIAIYEGNVEHYEARRPPIHHERARRLAATRLADLPVLDAGCGPGGYLPHLPRPVVALDAAAGMVARAREVAPDAVVVQADLAMLPFRTAAFGGAWARNSYVHVPSTMLPIALRDLHRTLAVGAPVVASFVPGDGDGDGDGPIADDDLPGRFFARWSPDRLDDAFTGAGFDDVAVDGEQPLFVTARRARTLADTVGARMRILVCGLNPSLVAADAGYGFAGPSNRFWKAALASGLVSAVRDPARALSADGVGMTDVVKRATPRSSEIGADEYRRGADRVRHLVGWLQPGAICFVGLEGWRIAVDRRARPGWQPDGFGGRPAYVLPSTSGLNASARLDDLIAHLVAAQRSPPSPPPS